jgi:hypothetical protein
LWSAARQKTDLSNHQTYKLHVAIEKAEFQAIRAKNNPPKQSMPATVASIVAYISGQ